MSIQSPYLNTLEQALPTADDGVGRILAATYGNFFRAVWRTEACDPANATKSNRYVGLSIAAHETLSDVNAFGSRYYLAPSQARQI